MYKEPTYSICIPNYNMGDTIERALVSVIEQVDDRYEVLVLDDGSTDNSVEILDKLGAKYPSLRVIKLKRDKNRKLGETRNISVREAKGEYVILHVDADDVWEPFINDFVTLFHRLEKCLGKDFLLSGQQLNIGKKDYLLKHGPYRNTHRAQDRDMWLRLAALDQYIPLDHKIFRTRLSRPKKVSFYKAIRDSWYHMLYDMRRGTALKSYILGCLTGLFYNKTKNFSFKFRLLRFAMVLPVFIASRFDEPLPPPENMKSHTEFAEYRERTRGTYQEIMSRHDCDPDISFLSEEAQKIFSTKEIVT